MDSFAGYSILNWHCLPFGTLNIWTHCLLPSQFLLRNLLIILLASSCMAICFFLTAFKNFSLSLAFDTGIIMCLTIDLWIHPTWNSLSFLAFYMISCQTGDISISISSFNLSVPSLFSF